MAITGGWAFLLAGVPVLALATGIVLSATARRPAVGRARVAGAWPVLGAALLASNVLALLAALAVWMAGRPIS